MIKKLFWRLFGLVLLAFCGSVWAWMFGAFSYLSKGFGANQAKWVAPGILSMPATVAVIVGLIGLLFVLGVFPVDATDEANDQTHKEI